MLQEELNLGRIAHTSVTPQPVVFNVPLPTVTQPRPGSGSRIPIPVSTIEGGGGPGRISSYIPESGLDFIRGIPSLHIYQTLELNDSLTALSSENRFSVRTPFNDTIYVATESSERPYLGAARPFRMHILDKTNQEAVVINRKMGLGLLCCTFVPQSVEIWLPPGNLIGSVRETFSLGVKLTVHDANEQIYEISGPKTYTGLLPREAHFRVLALGGPRIQVGTITHSWNADSACYSTNIYYTDANMDVHRKSLLLGAAFLLEYMFFQGRNYCYK